MPNASASPNPNASAQNQFLALSTKIANVYSEALRQNIESLSVSSARIIQEQTIKAWMQAAQSCSTALAKNAMSHQQQAIERIADANRKAFGVLGWNLSSFKMQPMTGFTNWLAAMPDTASSAKAKSRRIK